MTAEEARKLADGNETDKFILKKIIASIEKAAKNGEYEMWYYDNPNGRIREELEKLGYKVGKTDFDRNEHLTKISW